MILNKKLNKKQLIVGWSMIVLIALVILRTTLSLFALPDTAYSSVRIFNYLYYFIIFLGLLLVYILRDKQKG